MTEKISDLSTVVKRIMVFNAKGGTGKTAIALNFALTFSYGIVTNDPSTIIESVLPFAKCLILSGNQDTLPAIPAELPIIYDFGGYPDSRALKALEDSEYVIVPVLPSPVDIETNLNFLEELKQYKPQEKIILVVNQLEGGTFTHFAPAFKKMAPIFKKYNPEVIILPLKKSASFLWMAEQKKTLAEISEQVMREKKVFANSFLHARFQFQGVVNSLLEKSGNSHLITEFRG